MILAIRGPVSSFSLAHFVDIKIHRWCLKTWQIGFINMFLALRNMFERNSLSTSSRSLSFLTGQRPWRRPRPSLVSSSARPPHTLTSSIPTTSSSPLSKQSSLISNNSCSRLDDPSSFCNFQVLIWPKGSKHLTFFFRFRRTSRSRAGLRSWRTILSCWSISFWQISESIRTTMIRLRYFLIFHRSLNLHENVWYWKRALPMSKGSGSQTFPVLGPLKIF